jgi:predicted ATPase
LTKPKSSMADQHQLNSIIATAICDACKDHSERRIDPEEAKQIAKCIVETLTGVGLEIVPVSND